MAKLKLFIFHLYKQFARNEFFTESIFLKIIAATGGLFILVVSLSIGIFIEKIAITLKYSGSQIELANQIVLVYLYIAFFYNYVLAPDIALSIKPYLLLPLKKQFIANIFLLWVLLSSLINYVHFFLFIPMGIVVLLPRYSILSLVAWFISIVSMTAILAIFALYLRKLYQTNWIRLGFVILFVLFCVGMQHLGIVDFTGLFLNSINNIIYNPVFSLFPVLILVIIYGLFYAYVKKQFYLMKDNKNKKHTLSRKTYLQKNFLINLLSLDMKLIWREENIRKSLLIKLIMVVFYIAFFLHYPENDQSGFLIILLISAIVGNFYIQYVFEWKANFFDFNLVKLNTKKYFNTLILINGILQGIIFTVISLILYIVSYQQMICPIIMFGVFYWGPYSFWTVFLHVKFPTKKHFSENKFFTADRENSFKTILLLLPIIVIVFLFKFYRNYLLIGLLVSGVVVLIFLPLLLGFIIKFFKQNKYKMATIFRETV